MRRRRPNPHLVKIHRSYTVHEISTLFGIHKNTARRWFKVGLERVGGKGQTLVRGQALRDFLSERRKKAKRPCPPGFMFCLPCRDRKEPYGLVADLIQTSPGSANLRGMCPDCSRLMHRRVRLDQLPQVRGRLDVSVPAAQPRIGEAS